MKNIIGLMAIIFFLASQFCLSQTDSLKISWDRNPTRDSIDYYILRRAVDDSLKKFVVPGDYSPIDTIYEIQDDSSLVPRLGTIDKDIIIKPGKYFSYIVQAFDNHGTPSPFSEQDSAGIPKIIWTIDTLVSNQDTSINLSHFTYDPDNNSSELKDSTSNENHVSLDTVGNYLTIIPEPGYSGPASFILYIKDPKGYWDNDTVEIEFVEPIVVNLQSDADTTNEDTPIEINLIENDSIPTGYSYSLVVDGSNLQYGQVEILNDSVVSYIPLASINSLLPDEIFHDFFRYRIRINGILTGFSNVDITVLGLNDQPVISAIPNDTVYVGFTYNYQVFATDPDSGDVLTFLPLSPNLNFLSINQNTGLISGSPSSLSDTGTFDITVQVRDLAGATDTENFQLAVKFIELTLDDFPERLEFAEDDSFQIDINEIEVSSYGYHYPMIQWEFIPSGNLYVDTLNLPLVNIYADTDSFGTYHLGVKVTDPNLIFDIKNVEVKINPRVDVSRIDILEFNSNEYRFRIFSDLNCTLLTEYWTNPQNVFTQSITADSINHTVTIPVGNLNGDSLYINFIVTDSSGFSKMYSKKYELTSIAIESIGEPFAFPNPYRPSHGHDQVFFDNIPSDAEKIVIFDVATNEVYSHNFRGTPTRRWGWNVINDDGKELASGLYIYVIFGPGNKKIKSGKIAVIR